MLLSVFKIPSMIDRDIIIKISLGIYYYRESHIIVFIVTGFLQFYNYN